MVVALLVAGNYALSCIVGVACVEVIGNPALVIAAGGFELVGEIFGITVYRKVIGKKDK